jgi:transglutaminase-like putative cysteine protease
VVLLFAGRLPLSWLLGCILVLSLRALMALRPSDIQPSRWVLAAVAMSLLPLAWLQFRGINGYEEGAAIFLGFFCLKSLEMYDRRAVRILLLLVFFALATVFILDQSIFRTFCAALVLLGCLMLMERTEGGQPPVPRLSLPRLGLLLLALAPLVAGLFLFFPRIAPLWTMPSPEPAGITGVSDRLRMGDVGRLIRSSEVAFRVRFEKGGIPPQQALYWRGLVLDRLEGNVWTMSDLSGMDKRSVPSMPVSAGPSHDYLVILEPTGLPWLFGLAEMTPNRRGIRRDARGLYRLPYPGYQPEAYRVTTRLVDPSIGGHDWPVLRQRNLQLPHGGNPRARAVAAHIREQYPQPEARVDALLDWVRRQNLVYSLEPPVMGPQPVDDFLFNQGIGFCEHFASSFVFLARAAGVPARIVLGYQGGALHPDSDYWIVRQYDAHAWTEVWLDRRGWIRIDPTLLAAPARAEQDFDSHYRSGAGMGGVWGFDRHSWPARMTSQLGLMADRARWIWQTRFLGYDGLGRQALMSRLFASGRAAAIWLAGGALVLLVLAWGVAIIQGWRPSHIGRPHERIMRRFLEYTKSKGYPRRPSETLHQYLDRLEHLGVLEPEKRVLLEAVWHARAYRVDGASLQSLRQATSAIRLTSLQEGKDA